MNRTDQPNVGDQAGGPAPMPLFDRVRSHVRRRRLELTILISLNAVYFFSYFQRVAVPGTIFDELQTAFGVTAGAIAGLGAVYLYVYSGMQLVAGVLNDRFGAARVLVAGGLLMSVGAILFPLAPSLVWLYAARVLIGLGGSLIYLSVVKSLDSLFGHALFPQYLGISVFLGYSGGLAGTFPFERLVHLVGWREALLIAGVFSLGAWAVTTLLLRTTRRLPHAPQSGSRLRLAEVVRNRPTRPLILGGAINFAIFFVLQATIGKKLLLDHLHVSSAAAASFTFLMMLASMTSALAGGFILRLIGGRRKPLLMTAATMTVTGCALLLVSMMVGLGATWFLSGYVLLGLASISTAASASLTKELNRPEAVATAIGFSNSCCYLAVAVLANVAGWILDAFSGRAVATAAAVVYPREAYTCLLGLCCLLTVVSFTAYLTVRDTRGQATPAVVLP